MDNRGGNGGGWGEGERGETPLLRLRGGRAGFSPLPEYGGGFGEGLRERGGRAGPGGVNLDPDPDGCAGLVGDVNPGPSRVVAKYLVRLGPAPIARRIILSIMPTVLEEIFTASPLYACTVLRFLRVFSDVRNRRARGGRGGGAPSGLSVSERAPGPALPVGVLVPEV